MCSQRLINADLTFGVVNSLRQGYDRCRGLFELVALQVVLSPCNLRTWHSHACLCRQRTGRVSQVLTFEVGWNAVA